MWTLNDLLNIANGSSLIKNDSLFEFSFCKKIKFHQLYEYIKRNKEYVCKRDIPQLSCLCEVVLYVRLTRQYFFYKYYKRLKHKIKTLQLAFIKTNQLKHTNKNP